MLQPNFKAVEAGGRHVVVNVPSRVVLSMAAEDVREAVARAFESCAWRTVAHPTVVDHDIPNKRYRFIRTKL